MPYDAFSVLRINVDAGIAFVTIDHPPVNLYDVQLMTELDRFTDLVTTDANVRVIVLESADPVFFIAHGDMNFINDPDLLASVHIGGDDDASLNPMQRLHERIRVLPQVTIGKLAGYARGGGAELLEALDMRFAARGSTGLSQNEVSTGIMPGAGATAYLPRLLGRARALEAILGAALFDADTAERYGWVNRALPADALDSFVLALARHIADLAPGVIAAAKTAINAADGSITEALRIQNKQLVSLGSAPIARELNLAALNAGAQTREGELNIEEIIRKLQGRRAG